MRAANVKVGEPQRHARPLSADDDRQRFAGAGRGKIGNDAKLNADSPQTSREVGDADVNGADFLERRRRQSNAQCASIAKADDAVSQQ